MTHDLNLYQMRLFKHLNLISNILKYQVIFLISTLSLHIFSCLHRP